MTLTSIKPVTVNAGEMMAPAKIDTEKARHLAALHLVVGDLSFALECFNAANALGPPTDSVLQSKSFIFSAVIAYGRCFKESVRAVRLNPAELESAGAPFDGEIHEYLIALRDKHVAHSVNYFEHCQTVALVVGEFGGGWRDGSAVGVIARQTIGLSRQQLHAAIEHVAKLVVHLRKVYEAKCLEVYNEFQGKFEKDGLWEMAPMGQVPDRSKVSQRRQKGDGA